MASGNYEYQSELVRRNVAKGREEGEIKRAAAAVLTVLEVRGLAIPEEVRQRVLASADLAELDRWHRRAVVVGAAHEIFEAGA